MKEKRPSKRDAIKDYVCAQELFIDTISEHLLFVILKTSTEFPRAPNYVEGLLHFEHVSKEFDTKFIFHSRCAAS